MVTETQLTSDEQVENNRPRTNGRASARLWIAAGLAGVVFVGAWLKYSPRASGSSAGAPPAALPQVVVSKPLAQDIDTRLGFLGQFSAVSQVELRAQAYKAGAIPLTDVLDADHQLLVARNDVESTRADAAPAAVRTFRALGGGWDVRSNPSIAAVK